MYLARVQDQPTMLSPKATVWCCVSTRGVEASEPTKQFAHRGSRSIRLSACLAARLGNPEDQH
jgi:hypothetical protein